MLNGLVAEVREEAEGRRSLGRRQVAMTYPDLFYNAPPAGTVRGRELDVGVEWGG